MRAAAIIGLVMGFVLWVVFFYLIYRVLKFLYLKLFPKQAPSAFATSVKSKEDYERWKAGDSIKDNIPREKQCPACMMIIHEAAQVCPHCKRQSFRYGINNTFRWVGIVVLVVLGVACLLSIFAMGIVGPSK